MNDREKLCKTLKEIGIRHIEWLGNDARSMEPCCGPLFNQVWSGVTIGDSLLWFGEKGNYLGNRMRPVPANGEVHSAYPGSYYEPRVVDNNKFEEFYHPELKLHDDGHELINRAKKL